MEKDESYIITRILAGKTEEYAYFLDTYGQPVFSLIVRMVNSEEDAEELTQDTFMKAFEHLSSFNGKSSFSTWIYRIAYNTALSFLRKKNVEQTVIDDNQWNQISDTQIDDALNNESEEQIEKLQQALTKLTAEERAMASCLLFSDFTLNLYHLFREARITSITNATISPSPPPSNTLAP